MDGGVNCATIYVDLAGQLKSVNAVKGFLDIVLEFINTKFENIGCG